MENITKFLRTAFYVFLFFIGITILYKASKSFSGITEKTADAIADDVNLYQTESSDTVHLTSRAELIAILMGDISYDISVMDPSGLYSAVAKAYNPGNITDITLTASQYEKSYSYDGDGQILKIMYRFIP